MKCEQHGDECPAMRAIKESLTCCDIVDDRPCGRTATRYNAESHVLFCDEHGGQNPRLPV
jgi:hypothetical protein